MAHYILIYHSPDSGETRFELDSERSYRMGSKADNDIVIDQKDVSRHHAILRVLDGSFHLTDLNSKNGTFVNGAQTADATVHCGDLINLSSARLVVVEVSSGAYPMVPAGDEASDQEVSDITGDTHQYRNASLPEDLIELLEVTADAVPRGALADPLSWAVARLGLDGAVVLYRGHDDGVAMITSAGDLGPLVGNASMLTRIVLGQWQSQGVRPRIQQLSELGERLLVCRLDDHHALVVRYAGPAPAVADIRAVVAAVETVIAGRGGAWTRNPTVEERSIRHADSCLDPLDRLWGVSARIDRVRRSLAELANTDAPFVVSGEPGVGKSLAAGVVHRASSRSTGPLVEVDCMGLASDRLDGLLSGGLSRNAGADEGAARGTLLLRRAERLDASVWQRLLDRYGSGSSLRLVATWREGRGTKRIEGPAEAFERVRMPTLRDRMDDIPVIVVRAAGRTAPAEGGLVFTDEAVGVLQAYSWPDNVRELLAEVWRLMAVKPDGGLVEAADLARRVREDGSGRGQPLEDLDQLQLAEARDAFEAWVIRRALVATGGNQSQAARRLGLSRAGLFKKVRRLGLTDLGDA